MLRSSSSFIGAATIMLGIHEKYGVEVNIELFQQFIFVTNNTAKSLRPGGNLQNIQVFRLFTTLTVARKSFIPSLNSSLPSQELVKYVKGTQ